MLALALFVRLKARLSDPLVPLSLFKSRTFSGANLLTLCLYGALSGALFFLPLNLIQVQGYSATAAGAALLPFVLLLSLLSRWSGGLVSRLGSKLPLMVGPSIVALGFVLFMLPGVEATYWTGFFPAVVVLGLGMAVAVAPLTTTVMNAVPEHYAGTASGVNNAASRAAGLLAIALFGILMLGVFSAELRRGLSPLELPPQAEQGVLSSRNDLAALTPPDTLSVEQQGAVNRTVDTAYLTGFRAVMGVSAGLALVSALIAWRMIEGRVAGAGQATESTGELRERSGR
jgi:predicted MFS family arabinose efflux permease